MKVEIKSRFDSSILFSIETDTLKLAVELGVKSGADLSRANLSRANLSGADLSGANLSWANLSGADLSVADFGKSKFPIQILGHKHFMQTSADGKLQIGCHVHTVAQWEKNAEKIGNAENYSPLDIEIYKLHIEHIAKVSRMLWNADKEKP